MSNDYKSPGFKKLLDSLQQQSWELELIISGFAIFGLFTAYEPLRIGAENAQNNQQIYQFVLYLVAFIACSILLFNLLLHVILRGLWIGALGLRYVSGDIEFDKLKYSEKFKNYLKKKIVSFDRYIANLENYCSVLFAISFLLIFHVVAITLIILSIALVANFIIDNDHLPDWISSWVGIPLVLFICFGMLLAFIDFITQGILKRNKWVARLYFPFYWVFSFLTLSFLYRPLVYNFLDNRFGKRIIFLLTPIYIVILLLSGLEYRNSNYLNKEKNSSTIFANKENYMDMMTEDEDYPGEAVIPSKVITTSYLQVFMPYSENIEERIFAFEESLKPEEDRRGLASNNFSFNTNWSDKITSERQKDSIRKHYLSIFNETYFFKIDSLRIDSDFIITTNNKNHLGFETFLNLTMLSEGRHQLRVMRKRREKDSIVELIQESIPFWYFKD
ncbi:hypothetical protein [Allomuricauda sp. SCSIO 65647]|uniref:hypothetical protein n=1 Tax=Allomuricauda sp. SCSIO 65647 TaxID=2908843 RepID=UPI001F3F51A5|nr:hypothetical protein [Muricauda sp. SCSIO 65647]UJH68019.1 hypothetical protein L0P89_02100 [Muricauda sp. SCSIO 65647]